MAAARYRTERRSGPRASERGAAAVEFALVALLMLTLVFGIAEFGRMWLLQSSLSAAARDGARTLAITNDWDEARGDAEAVFSEEGAVFVPENDCDSGDRAEVSGTYEAEFMTGFFNPIFDDGTIALTGKGVMRCGG